MFIVLFRLGCSCCYTEDISAKTFRVDIETPVRKNLKKFLLYHDSTITKITT